MRLRHLMPAAACLAITSIACGGGTNVSTEPTEPPKNLRYASNPVTYVVGAAITPNVPTWSGGPASSFTVTPPLPQGLTLNGATGVVTGTPTSVSPATNYGILAGNTAGYTVVTLVIAVGTTPPVTVGSCVNFTTAGGAACVEVSSNFPLDLRQQCAQDPAATYSPDPCATTGRTGRCVLSNPAGASMTLSYYGPVPYAPSFCASLDGQSGFTSTWIPG